MEIVVRSKNSVSIKVPKETVPFQQARFRIPNLGAELNHRDLGKAGWEVMAKNKA